MTKIEKKIADEIYLDDNYSGSFREATLITNQILEIIKTDRASEVGVEPEVSFAEPNRNCENCKHKYIDNDHTSASYGEFYCNRHGNNLWDMFNSKLKLSACHIGCNQFEQK